MDKVKDRYLPLFVGDFFASTLTWTGPERGLYLQLLMMQWSAGPLPADLEDLAIAAGYRQRDFDALWVRVATKFTNGDGHYRNGSLETVRAKNLALQEAASKKGKHAAEARHSRNHAPSNAPSNAPRYAPEMPSDSDSESDSDADKIKAKKTLERRSVARAPPIPRGTRLPKEFSLTTARAAYATKHHLDPQRVYGMFTTYWWAKAGSGATKLDWEATWQHWCMKDAEKNVPRKTFMDIPAKAAPTTEELEERENEQRRAN